MLALCDQPDIQGAVTLMNTHTCMHTHTCTHKYTYTHTCVCVCACSHTSVYAFRIHQQRSNGRSGSMRWSLPGNWGTTLRWDSRSWRSKRSGQSCWRDSRRLKGSKRYCQKNNPAESQNQCCKSSAPYLIVLLLPSVHSYSISVTLPCYNVLY